MRLNFSSMAVVLILLTGCSDKLRIVNPPPIVYHVPPPANLTGLWVFEARYKKDASADMEQYIQVTEQKDGTLRMSFITAELPGERPEKAAANGFFIVQALRFDNTDWLQIDWRKTNIAFGDPDTKEESYKLARFVRTGPDRLCGNELEVDRKLFINAINAKQLKGNQYSSPLPTVTATGAEWVEWWTKLPLEKKEAPLDLCFLRVRGVSLGEATM